MRRARGAAAGDAVKVVVTGPFSAGKTTLIRTISEITVLSTERDITDQTRSRKAETTVAMDFGRITIDRELVLYLFGTPGQDRFDFMWEILGEGMIGFILLVDPTREDSLREAAGILDAFRRMSPVPFVIAANRWEAVSSDAADSLRDVVGAPADTPVIACDATDRGSVRDVLLALLYAVLDSVEASSTDAALVPSTARPQEIR
jgi:small GTP-binding protein